ncbi:MAG: hypothetical protein PHD40_01045 [Syntrophomonadaceae bacterium]|nr:hypothetical protein [Syntrophomonadaceae bacterium]
MSEAIAIWAPVIISRLEKPGRLQEQYRCALDQTFKSIEDLKIKVRQMTVQPRGRSLEAIFKLDALCLLEDHLGEMQLISREITARQRLSRQEFINTDIMDKMLVFVINLLNADARATLQQGELQIDYYIDYLVLATREQIVSLSTEEQGRTVSKVSELVARLQQEVNQLQGENRQLRHKIYLYEKDILSLKKGVYKAEKQSQQLNGEVDYYRGLTEQLQEAIKDKEARLIRYENPYYPTGAMSEEEASGLGKRIKRLFAASS